jgi:hypothetical protein
MAGEINGTNVLIKKGANNGADIVGQMEFTLTHAGSPIDLSNKTYGDFVTLLNGELSGKQLTFAGTLVYNSDATYRNVVTAAYNATIEQYSLVWPDGYYITADFMPNGLSDALPHGDKVATTINFLSSGEFGAPTNT